jgi:hypothetical protein
MFFHHPETFIDLSSHFISLFVATARAYREMLEASRFRALRAVVASTFHDGGLRAFYVGLTPGTMHAHTHTHTPLVCSEQLSVSR